MGCLVESIISKYKLKYFYISSFDLWEILVVIICNLNNLIYIYYGLILKINTATRYLCIVYIKLLTNNYNKHIL